MQGFRFTHMKVAGALLVLVLSGTAAAQAPFLLDDPPTATATRWSGWGGGIDDLRYAPAEHKLNPSTVGRLQPAWIFTAGGEISATAAIENHALYLPDWGGWLYRLDTDTGKVAWQRRVSEYTGNVNSVSRSSPAIGPRSIVIGDYFSGYVLAVDKTSGKLLWKTSLESDSYAEVLSSPVIIGNRVYVGLGSHEAEEQTPGHVFSARGGVAALDLDSGKLLWLFRTAPVGYAGAAVWGTVVPDPVSKTLYATTGNNYAVPAAVSACEQAAGADRYAQSACLAPDDYVDSVLALDLDTGKLKWSRRLNGADAWTLACYVTPRGPNCPTPGGPDFDFGAGANLFTVLQNGKPRQLLGAGSKSGVYWVLDPKTGQTVWSTQVGPYGNTSAVDGILWGIATDGNRIYVAINNIHHVNYTLGPDHRRSWNAGSWAALDAASGKILWQVPASGTSPVAPGYGASGVGPATVAAGVVYVGSQSGDMVALDARNGSTLWSLTTGGAVVAGASVVDGAVYWGSGYSHLNYGLTNNKLYKLALPAAARP